MKHAFKVLLTLCIIGWGCVIVAGLLDIIESPAIGTWIVDMYEEFTNEYGHTVQGMYIRLTELVALAASLMGCLSIPVVVLGILAYKSKEDSDMTNEKENVVKEEKAKKSFRIKKEKKVKEEVAEEKVVVEEVKNETKHEKDVNAFLNSLKRK